ncbi:MAG: HAD-IC family P-type ATPase [Gammaproteobacteria bacterium]|nr:HAD-IC family P-type ATPase [Gammaproteobacteria bacterium]
MDDLHTDRQRGLHHDTVEPRQREFGANRLPRKRRAGVVRVFLRQFRDPLIYVLLAAAIVSLAIGNLADAAFIAAVLLLNAGLGTFQEYRAESAASALEEVITVITRVIRGGEERELEAEQLVPGDLVRLKSGDAVPADLRLLDSDGLRLDESLLTGESTPVEKDAEGDVDEDTALAERETMAHAGSTVLSGRALGVVVGTGKRTEIGRIAESLVEEQQVPPLVLRMRRFTRTIAVAIGVVVLVLGGVQFLRGADPVELFFLAVALAVSAIPAGLPVAITVALSIASNRMAERNVVVRRLPAVEGLGACTLIASDKTGTLTENRLTVRRLVAPDDDAEAELSGESDVLEGELTVDGETVSPEDHEWLAKLLETGLACNEGRIESADDGLEVEGDTADIAFLVAAGKVGLDRDDWLDGHEQVGEIPFESERRFAASFHRHDDIVLAHVKGAAEVVLEMCDGVGEAAREAEERLAADGFRVMALARGEVDSQAAESGDEDALGGLEFLGLVGLIDPVRPEVEDAVSRCRDAGVGVCMITGDHPTTALGIAREIGFADEDDEAIVGSDLDEGEDERFRDAHVFARVEPLQKTDIVERLRDAGHFVAVTGDGVNDAPALRRAHIGVAMGRGGTDVARNAADLILTDDNFASIVNGVEEGRIAYDNVRKVIWLLISTGVAELILFTLAVALDTPLPLTPVQLLWLNLVTNGIQDVAMAFERGEPGVLSRRPRHPDEPIFDRLMIEQVLLSGVYMGLVAFAVFMVLLGPFGMDTFEARNLLVLLLVLFENVHAFNVRSETRSAFRIPLSANPLLVLSVVLAQGIHVGSMFVPGWRDVLQIAPVSPGVWAALLAITLSKFLVVEVYKWLRGRSLAQRQMQPAT